MLKCNELVEHSDALLAGELGWRQRWAMRMHLIICRHCRRYLNQLRRLLGAIPGMHGVADEAEVDEVMRRIREDGQR